MSKLLCYLYSNKGWWWADPVYAVIHALHNRTCPDIKDWKQGLPNNKGETNGTD